MTLLLGPMQYPPLVFQSLEKVPSKRPTTAYEVENALASILFDDPWDIHRAAIWWEQSLPTAPDETDLNAFPETIRLTTGDTE